MAKQYHFSVLLLLFFAVGYTNNASINIYEQKKYKSLLEGQGLYTIDDDVDILTVHNFNDKIYGQKHAWLVEFYNSWCGFCQRFAPSWKDLATDVKKWKNFMRIGAIDCSDDDNTELCRKFDIMGFPTLRYFHEGYEEAEKNVGEQLHKGTDVNTHRRYLVQHMILEQASGRGQQYPNIQPYNHTDLTHLFTNPPIKAKYIHLIFDTDDDPLGAEVALDLHLLPNTVVRYMRGEGSTIATSLGLKEFPALLEMTDDGVRKPHNGPLTRAVIRDTISLAVNPQGLQPLNPAMPIDQPDDVNQALEDVPDMEALMQARQKVALRAKIRAAGDVVFQADLENALRYALKHEVSTHPELEGERREALLGFLAILVKYWPATKGGKQMLKDLQQAISSANPTPISDLTPIIHRIDDPSAHIFSTNATWLACEGSNPRFRGYPCGLWTTFHYLTVAARESGSIDGNEVLSAMHGYIKHFFGCSDCSNHFQEMAKRNDIFSTKSTDAAILWLWMSHNEVNRRLSGDDTEDPDHQKVQFPTPANCPGCRDTDGKWILPMVIKYLQKMYADYNVRLIGSDYSIFHKSGKTEDFKPPEEMAFSGGAFFQRIDTTRVPEKDVRT